MEISARFLSFTTYGVQWVLWLLIGLSLISIGMMLERLWHFAIYRPNIKALAKEILALLASAGIGRAAPDAAEGTAISREAYEAAFEGAKARERLGLERNLAFLGTLGSNAPFIGLFGTVLGIIKAFHDLAGNQAGGPAVVMAGISEALVATAIGLMVAIPAVVAFNYFNRRVRTIMTQVDWTAHLALAEVKASAALGPDAAAAPVKSPEAVGKAAPISFWRRQLIRIGVVGAIGMVGAGFLVGHRSGPPPRPVTPVAAIPTPSAETRLATPAAPPAAAPSHEALPPAPTTAAVTPPPAAPAVTLPQAAPAAALPVVGPPAVTTPGPASTVQAVPAAALPTRPAAGGWKRPVKVWKGKRWRAPIAAPNPAPAKGEEPAAPQAVETPNAAAAVP